MVRKLLLPAAFVLLLGIFLYCAVNIGIYFWESKQTQDAYDALAQLRQEALAVQPTLPQETSPDPTGTETAPTAPTEPVSPYVTVSHPETGEPFDLLPEYAGLFQMNPDFVGWITIEDTLVNYPVMQSPDYPDYYLYRGFDKKHSSHGSVYVREACDVLAPSDNLTIYGHRMQDGTMFYDLQQYKKKSFWEEHDKILFDTLRHRGVYQIFAVFLTSATPGKGFAYHRFDNAENAQDYDAFVSQCKKLSLYDTGFTPQYGDKLITLSTCEYSQENGRLVVVAMEIPSQE